MQLSLGPGEGKHYRHDSQLLGAHNSLGDISDMKVHASIIKTEKHPRKGCGGREEEGGNVLQGPLCLIPTWSDVLCRPPAFSPDNGLCLALATSHQNVVFMQLPPPPPSSLTANLVFLLKRKVSENLLENAHEVCVLELLCGFDSSFTSHSFLTFSKD